MLKDFVKSAMIEELGSMEGQSFYGADLGYGIFEKANIDGSYTYDSEESKNFIKEYFDELGEVVENIKDNLGADSVPNVFDNPEAFQVVIMLEVSADICSNISYIEEHWNDEIELKQEVIDLLINEIKTY